MMKHTHSRRVAGIFLTAALLASPLAMASAHGGQRGDDHGGKYDKAEMCEKLREGKGWFNDEKRQEKWAEHRAETADRLQLTDEQREIWNEINKEKMEKHRAKKEQWQEKMKERCENREGRNSSQ